MPSCYPIHWYLSTRVWTKSKGRLSLYMFVRICTKNVRCQLKALIPPIVQGNPSPLILGIPFPILLRGPIPASLWVPIPLLVCFSFLVLPPRQLLCYCRFWFPLWLYRASLRSQRCRCAVSLNRPWCNLRPNMERSKTRFS